MTFDPLQTHEKCDLTYTDKVNLDYSTLEGTKMDNVLYRVVTTPPPPTLKSLTYEITYIKITKKGPHNPYTLIPLTLSPAS